MSDHAESPTENQKDDPSIQHTATEHTGSSDVGKKMNNWYVIKIKVQSMFCVLSSFSFIYVNHDGKLVLHYCKSQAWR
uniref:Uncharacterized protein n=2 Tax=Cyprinus carpio TaxID=7962 RepID=A0A9J8CU11_CYPCA